MRKRSPRLRSTPMVYTSTAVARLGVQAPFTATRPGPCLSSHFRHDPICLQTQPSCLLSFFLASIATDCTVPQSFVFVSVSDLRPLGRGQTHVLPRGHIAMEEFFSWQQGTHGEVGSLGPGWNMEADPEHGEPSCLDMASHTYCHSTNVNPLRPCFRARTGTTRRAFRRKGWPQGHPNNGPRILCKPRRVVHRGTRRQESTQTSATHSRSRGRLHR